MLLIICCLGTGIRVAHCFFILGGGSVVLMFFSFWEGIRVAHVHFFWEANPCCQSFFVLGEGFALLMFFCFGRGIRVAHLFLF